MESSVDIELLMETANVLNRTGRDLVSCCNSDCRSIINELDRIASKYRDYSNVTNKVREIKAYINNILKLSRQLEETNQNLVTGLKNAAKVYKEGEKQAKGIVTKDKTTIGGKIVSKIGDKTPDLPRHKSIKEVDIKSEEDAKEYVTELEQKAKDIEMYIAMLNNYRASGQGEPEWLIKKLEELGVTYGIIKNTDELVVNKKDSESLYSYDDDIAQVIDLGACILVKYTNGLIQLFNKNDIPRGSLKAFEDKNLWSAGGVPLKTIAGFVGKTQEDVSFDKDKRDCVINNNLDQHPKVGSTTITKINYKEVFFKQNPELRGKVVVHHGIEQQVLIRPETKGLFTEIEIHVYENLRGIPNEINSDIHLSQIRKEWNKFYKENPSPTKEQLLQKREEIDKKFGDRFNPPIE